MTNPSTNNDLVAPHERFATVLMMVPFLNALGICFLDLINQTSFEMPIYLGISFYIKRTFVDFPRWGLILLAIVIFVIMSALIYLGVKRWWALYEIALGLYLVDTAFLFPLLSGGEIAMIIINIIVHGLFIATGVLANIAYFKRKKA